MWPQRPSAAKNKKILNVFKNYERGWWLKPKPERRWEWVEWSALIKQWILDKKTLSPSKTRQELCKLAKWEGRCESMLLNFASNTEFFRNNSFTLPYKSMRSAVLIVGICIRKLGYSSADWNECLQLSRVPSSEALGVHFDLSGQNSRLWKECVRSLPLICVSVTNPSNSRFPVSVLPACSLAHM